IPRLRPAWILRFQHHFPERGKVRRCPTPTSDVRPEWARTAAGGAARVASASNRTPRAIPRGAFTRRDRSDVVVHLVLDGRRVLTQASDLVLALVLDPGLDDVPGEHVSLQQELVITLQSRQGVLQGDGELRDVLQLLGAEAVEILVEGIARIDAVLDAVEARHEHGGECHVGVAGGVGEAYL